MTNREPRAANEFFRFRQYAADSRKAQEQALSFVSFGQAKENGR